MRTEKTRTTPSFSARHPLLFGLLFIFAAAVLIFGMAAAFRYYVVEGSGSAQTKHGKRFGLVDIYGEIIDSREVVEFMDELAEDEDVLGVVVRVDSPGGGVAASQELYRAVKRMAELKPTVVSMGSVAASGGYYCSAPATRIVANPGTLTANIGVRLDHLDLRGLMEKIGLRYEHITSGPLKTAGSPFTEMTGEQRTHLQALVDDFHDQFVTDVALGRGMDKEVVAKLANGQAMTGRMAQEAGLVDVLGGLDTAFGELKSLTGTSKELPVQEGPVEEIPFIERVMGASMSQTLADALATALLGSQERLLARLASESATPERPAYR